MTDQKQGARMLTLGERIVMAARLAAEEHLRQSVSQALPLQTTAIAIGGADPVMVDDETPNVDDPLLLVHRLRQAVGRYGRRAEAA